MPASRLVCLVTGANRGLGKEAARQLVLLGHTVYVAARDLNSAKAVQDELNRTGAEVYAIQIDVCRSEQIQYAYEQITEKFGRLDVLVNNAGVFLDSAGPEDSSSPFEAAEETLVRSFETNTLGPFRMIQKFLPLMLKNGFGRIVNVSSGMGQLSEMNGGYPGYRISKTALNAVTRIFHNECLNSNVLVNSVCPGWVKTDMGGSGAELSIEEGVQTIVWLATLPDRGPSGGFFREKKSIDW